MNQPAGWTRYQDGKWIPAPGRAEWALARALGHRNRYVYACDKADRQASGFRSGAAGVWRFMTKPVVVRYPRWLAAELVLLAAAYWILPDRRLADDLSDIMLISIAAWIAGLLVALVISVARQRRDWRR